MSFEAAAWAIKQKTNKPIEKLVLIGLADCYNKHNSRCDPSIIYLSKVAICSERQVTRSINELVIQGLISIQRQTGRRTNYNIILTPDTVSPLPRLTVTPTPDSQSKTPDCQSPKPVITSKETSKEPWEPDEDTLTVCKMAGVEVTQEMVCAFRLKILDWKDKNFNSVGLRTKFVSHCKGIKYEVSNNGNQTLEQRLNDTSWAQT